MIFWRQYNKYRIRKPSCEDKEHNIWTFIIGDMVIIGTFSIPISKVNDMKSDVLWAVKGISFLKENLNLFWGLNNNNFQSI